MSENPASPSDAQEDLMARVDTSVPVSARIWNYWMGGTDYYPVDKAAGDAYATLSPGVFDLASSAGNPEPGLTRDPEPGPRVARGRRQRAASAAGTGGG